MIHQTILKYRNARYFWWAVGLLIVCIAVFATQGGSRPAGGGTWQGYTLGTIGALLIVWLSLLGIRKRSYASRSGTVLGWTSAHVYLGTALLVVGTLHCAGKFGWNIHSLAYALMVLVIVSGLCGIYIYLSVPQHVAENQTGGGRSELFSELYALNNEALALTGRADAAIQMVVKSSIERTVIGGGAFAQLLGRDDSRFLCPHPDSTKGGSKLVRNLDQQAAIEFVATRLPRAQRAAEVPQLQQLVVLMSRRQSVLRRVRRDIRLSAWLQVWLFVHIPATVALLVALLLHIVITFMYW
jgi:hypothetical protein